MILLVISPLCIFSSKCCGEEKKAIQGFALHISYLAIIVATVKLTSTSAWTEHCPSWFQGCTHTVLLQTKRPMEASEALLHCCRGTVGTVGTVGLSDVLSDCRTVGDDARASSQRNHCRTLSDNCRTLSDCRTVGTVGLSDNCRTLSESTVGLSDRGSSQLRHPLQMLGFD